MELHVGCPMWTYAPWQGRYLPASLGSRERLRAYATWCNAVEGNTTFYAIPALSTVRSWAEREDAERAAWAAPGVILAAAYLLWLFQRVFFGQNNNPKNAGLKDLSARELATFVPLVVLAFAIGLYPKPLFQILAVPVNNLVATVRPDYPGVTKPVVAGEPARTAEPNAAIPLPEPQKTPEVKAPTSQTGASGRAHVQPVSSSRSSLFALRLSRESREKGR